MQITDVRIRRVEKEGKMKAVVSITIDEEFVVHDIKIIEGEKGLFIGIPRYCTSDQLWYKRTDSETDLGKVRGDISC